MCLDTPVLVAGTERLQTGALLQSIRGDGSARTRGRGENQVQEFGAPTNIGIAELCDVDAPCPGGD
jgi:hypothetical protein